MSSQAATHVFRARHSPPFQGGVAAPVINEPVPLAAQTGWFSNSDCRTYQPPRPLPDEVASQHLLESRGHPSLERRGVWSQCHSVTLTILVLFLALAPVALAQNIAYFPRVV